MASLDSLKSALSDRYRIERHLGAGGMVIVQNWFTELKRLTSKSKQ